MGYPPSNPEASRLVMTQVRWNISFLASSVVKASDNKGHAEQDHAGVSGSQASSCCCKEQKAARRNILARGLSKSLAKMGRRRAPITDEGRNGRQHVCPTDPRRSTFQTGPTSKSKVNGGMLHL